jgi:hypothetical protein
LEDFSATETRALTDHLTELGLPVEQDTHAEIYSWTNGHPYLTQRLCTEPETAFHQDHLPAIFIAVVTQIVNQVISTNQPVRETKISGRCQGCSGLRFQQHDLQRCSLRALSLAESVILHPWKSI